MHGEQKTLDVGLKRLVEVFFGDCAERGEFSDARVGEENVDVALNSEDRIEDRNGRRIRQMAR